MPLDGSNPAADSSLTQMYPQPSQEPLGAQPAPPPPQPSGFYAVPGQSQEAQPAPMAVPGGGAQPFPQPMGVAPLGGGAPLPAQPYGQPMPPPMGYGNVPPGAVAPAPAPAPQSFAIPGSKQENAEAPPPFQPPQPLPIVPQYQWQPGVYHSVGAPVQIQQVYYPPPP